jgi:predicted dehydrogenase
LKIGVVGQGSIGRRHADNARQFGHDVRVYDPAYPSDFTREAQLYDWCDAAVVATPSQFHEGPLRACVERGKHVLIEKPISVGIGLLPDLLRIADDKSLVVMMGNNLRFHPCVQMAKRWIAEGCIGRPLWAHFTCAQQNTKYTDSVVLNWGAHEVDIALHLLGPARVLCANVEDDKIADFVLKHDSGARSSFHLDYVTLNEIREFWIAGETDNIGIDLPSRHITCQRLGSSVGPGGDYDADYLNEMCAFVSRIDGMITPGATGHDGLETLRVLLDVRKKAGL